MERFSALKGRALLFLLFIWFLWFLSFTSRAIFSPVLPLIEDEFAINHATASSVFAYISVGYAVSLFFSGLLGGWVGYKKSICFSMLLASLALGAVQFVATFPIIRYLAFVVGLAAGMYIPAVLPLITAYYSEKTWGRAIPIHDSAASFSIFSSPLICLFFLHYMPWRGIFAILAGLTFLCGVGFYFSGPEVRRPAGARSRFLDLLKRKSLWITGIIWTFASGTNLGLYFIFPIYLTKELQMDMDSANAIFGVSRLGGIGIVISAGFLIDRFDLKKGIQLNLLLTGLLTMALVIRDIAWLKIFLFLQASFAVGFFPLTFVLISRIFGPEVRSQATGVIVTLGVILGIGLIPYLLGLSGDLISFRLGIFLLGVVTALSSGVLYYLREER